MTLAAEMRSRFAGSRALLATCYSTSRPCVLNRPRTGFLLQYPAARPQGRISRYEVLNGVAHKLEAGASAFIDEYQHVGSQSTVKEEGVVF